MQDPGILEVIAELGIAVLGFSGIVVVLGRRSSGDWSDLDHFRFNALLRSASGVVVLSLLPFPLVSAGATEAQVWGWSSAMGTFVFMIAVRGSFKSVALSQFWSNPEVSKLTLLLGLLAALGGSLLLALNATGILFEHTFTPYLVAVLLLLASSLAIFTRIFQVYIGPAARSSAD